MDNEWKGTKGIWMVKPGVFDAIETDAGAEVCGLIGNMYDSNLTADAGNTVQKCGMMPSDLLEVMGDFKALLLNIVQSKGNDRERCIKEAEYELQKYGYEFEK